MPRGRPKKITTEETKTTEAKTIEPVKKEPKSKYVFGLGRRKSAIARVFLYEEKSGQFLVNGKSFEEYF